MLASIAVNVLTGLAGAFIVWLLGRLFESVVNYRLSKRYSLTGKYLTTYEDLQDGNRVVRKASAFLTQKGKSVIGHTSNLADKRTWKLSLEIVNNKYLVGTYSSYNLLDPGLGVVFLEILPNQSLEGLWAGFDSANKIIEKGRYRFIKELPAQITDLAGYIPESLALFGKMLGEKYISRTDLKTYTTCERKAGFVALNNSAVAGVAICEVLGSLDSLPEAGKIKEILPGAEYFSFGLLRSIAVDSAYQGKGIGTRLSAECVKWLKNNKVTAIVALAWVEDKCNASGILEAQGFIPCGTLEKYWYNDSLAKEYKCPKCGNPCQCSAVLYVLWT